MKNKLIITGLVSMLCAFAPSVQAQHIANIDFGSFPGAGGAAFWGTDSAAADSIAVGYFSGAANIGLTGWTAFGTDTTFENPATGFNRAVLASVNVTAAAGSDAWVLIADAGIQALVRLNSWASVTGAAAPASPTSLDYTFGATATAAGITTLGDVTVQDGGGFQGSGVSFTLVPEPATYAALLGIVALVGVVVYRRR